MGKVEKEINTRLKHEERASLRQREICNKVNKRMAIFLKSKKALRCVMSILKFHFLFSASMKPHKRRGWRQTFQFISLVIRAATEHYFEVAICTVRLFIKRKLKKDYVIKVIIWAKNL